MRTEDEMKLTDRLNELGWGTAVPRLTAFANIVALYLAAELDPGVPRRLIDGGSPGDGDMARGQCEAALVAMLDEAEREGKTDLLRPPRVRDPSEVLSMLERIYDDE